MQNIAYILNSTCQYIFIYFSFIFSGSFLFIFYLLIFFYLLMFYRIRLIFLFLSDKLQSMSSFKE